MHYYLQLVFKTFIFGKYKCNTNELSNLVQTISNIFHKHVMIYGVLPCNIKRNSYTHLMLMSYLRYLCLFAYSGVQHILCCFLFCFVSLRLVLCWQFLWIVYFWLPLRYVVTIVEIQCLAWNRHNNVVALNRLMESQPWLLTTTVESIGLRRLHFGQIFIKIVLPEVKLS
jgi:hypothetical protein